MAEDCKAPQRVGGVCRAEGAFCSWHSRRKCLQTGLRSTFIHLFDKRGSMSLQHKNKQNEPPLGSSTSYQRMDASPYARI